MSIVRVAGQAYSPLSIITVCPVEKMSRYAVENLHRKELLERALEVASSHLMPMVHNLDAVLASIHPHVKVLCAPGTKPYHFLFEISR